MVGSGVVGFGSSVTVTVTVFPLSVSLLPDVGVSVLPDIGAKLVGRGVKVCSVPVH